jgi:hypothetical protein
VKNDAAAPAVGAPALKAKKGIEKKVGSLVNGDDEAVWEQQDADDVDAIADEPDENCASAPFQGELFIFRLVPLYSDYLVC